MKKITNKKILNIVAICILLLVPFFKFFSMNLEALGIMNNYDNINPAIALYISIPFLLFIYISDIIKNKRKLDIFDYIFYALVISGIISVIFSIDKSLAIYGKEFRHEGFLSVLSYYLLFINYKINGTKEDVKKFLKLIIIIGIINSLYSLLQIYTNFGFILRFSNNSHMASGLCGNPNFLGSLIVTCLGIMICKILMDKKIGIKDILITILLFISLINVQSTGPFFTFILVFIFFIILIYMKKELILKNVLILMILFITTYTAIYFINKDAYKISECEICTNQIKKTIDSGGSGRLKIWKNSLDIVKDNFIVGVGFDNFYLVYPNPKINYTITLSIATDDTLHVEKETYQIIDNAHNIYLHILVSTGIIGLIPYLSLLIFTFYKCICSKNKLIFILFGGFLAYSIQAFANISVVQVAPIYYIIIGLILSYKE